MKNQDLRSKSVFYPRRREAGANSAPKASVTKPKRDDSRTPNRSVTTARHDKPFTETRELPMEILSPAGSPEALRAAVCAGADAVYLLSLIHI